MSEPLSVHRGCRPQRGFTLIELMVAIFMIGIVLGMIIVPNLLRAARRASMLAQVKLIQQAVAVARIYSIKNSAWVALQLMPYEARLGNGTEAVDQEVFAWVDSNANGALDGGEVRVGRWELETDTKVSIDEFDSNRSLHQLANPALGVVFLPNGTSIAHGDQIGSGMGAMVLEDLKGNRLRLSVLGGAGSVRVDMWDYDNGQYSDRLNMWRY
jgi:prepilin-type N-terminal cleavage/methylation domain-containing protein